MKATLQVDDQFGPDGPQRGTHMIVDEIRKIDGEFWAFCVTSTGQDMYATWSVKLDHLMVAHTANTLTYWSTR